MSFTKYITLVFISLLVASGCSKPETNKLSTPSVADSKEYAFMKIQWDFLSEPGGKGAIGCYYFQNSPIAIYSQVDDKELIWPADVFDFIELAFLMPVEGSKMDFDLFFSKERAFDSREAFENGGNVISYPDRTFKRFKDDGSVYAMGTTSITYLSESDVPAEVVSVVMEYRAEAKRNQIPVSKWPKPLLRAIDRDLNKLYSDGKFKVVDWNSFQKVAETAEGIEYQYSVTVEYYGKSSIVTRMVTAR